MDRDEIARKARQQRHAREDAALLREIARAEEAKPLHLRRCPPPARALWYGEDPVTYRLSQWGRVAEGLCPWLAYQSSRSTGSKRSAMRLCLPTASTPPKPFSRLIRWLRASRRLYQGRGS
jgi:hypothetical protein